MVATDANIPGSLTGHRPITGRRPDIAGVVFQLLLLLCLVVCFGLLIQIVTSVVSDGWSTLNNRGTDFLSSNLSRLPQRAGVWQGIVGSIILAAFVAVVAFPLGIATAVYLEEYAPATRLTRFISLNIRNLAGVPSVVYGLLGLAVFVRLAKDATGGRSLISGGLTLAILVLPIVIITSAEALRAVPSAYREGAYGLGATRWDVVRTQVLPNAAPGILTGTVLALSRALGETAPLILVGAFFGTFFSTPNQGVWDQLHGTYTALPMIVFQWAGEARSEFKNELAPAAIVVLLGITLLCNLTAVLLRSRYERDR
jgi:phosphate transport system permease protein